MMTESQATPAGAGQRREHNGAGKFVARNGGGRAKTPAAA